MESFDVFAGGAFVRTSRELPVYNPYDGEVFARSFLADEAVFEQAVNGAWEAFPRLACMPAFERSRILYDLHRALLQQEKRFASLIAREAAKPWRLALAETRRAAQTLLVAAEEVKRPPMEYMRLDWSPDSRDREGLVKYFPIGPVAGISPFNFPLNLAMHKIAPAIAAGCPMVLKPASSTPLATLAFAQLVAETDLPAGSLSVLPMDRQTGSRLVTDERFRLLSFTGSPEVGWQMKQQAGKKKVVLELGGNAGTIIAATADLDQAVRRSVMGAFAYQGQICIHAQRFYVHESLYEAFSKGLVEGARALKYGDPMDAETEITAMIDRQNAERIESWTEEARSAGAVLLCGGGRREAYFEPTVVDRATPGMQIVDQEVFAPLVTLHPFSSFQEAIYGVNNSRYGLQAGVFTRNTEEIRQAFEQLEVGGVIHNDVPVYRTDHMPYGGVKDSGLGREGVKYAMHDMLEARILVMRTS